METNHLFLFRLEIENEKQERHALPPSDDSDVVIVFSGVLRCGCVPGSL